MSVGILVVGLIIFVAHLFVVVFKKTRIPDVLLLMIFGIAVGPVLGLIKPADFGIIGPLMSSVALIVILFEGGLNLNIHAVLGALGQTTLIGGLTWLLSAAVTAVLMYLLTPVGWGMSIMAGAILGATSPAVVVPLIRMLDMAEKPRTVLFLESALTDVLCIVVAIGIAQAMKSGDLYPARMVGHITASFTLALIIGVAGALGWSMLLGWVRQFPNTIFASVAWVFILYGVCEMMDLSGPIAALAAGVTLANVGGKKIRTPRKQKVVEMQALTDVDHLFIGETVFILKTFFFIFLGISIRFDSIFHILVAGAVVVSIFAIRFVIVRLLANRAYTTRDASLMTVMVPKGLAAAVLAFLPGQFGLPNADWISGIIFPAVLISIVLTSLMTVALEMTPLRAVYSRLFKGFAPAPAGAGMHVPSVGDTEDGFGPDGLPALTLDDSDDKPADS